MCVCACARALSCQFPRACCTTATFIQSLSLERERGAKILILLICAGLSYFSQHCLSGIWARDLCVIAAAVYSARLKERRSFTLRGGMFEGIWDRPWFLSGWMQFYSVLWMYSVINYSYIILTGFSGNCFEYNEGWLRNIRIFPSNKSYLVIMSS